MASAEVRYRRPAVSTRYLRVLIIRACTRLSSYPPSFFRPGRPHAGFDEGPGIAFHGLFRRRKYQPLESHRDHTEAVQAWQVVASRRIWPSAWLGSAPDLPRPPVVYFARRAALAGPRDPLFPGSLPSSPASFSDTNLNSMRISNYPVLTPVRAHDHGHIRMTALQLGLRFHDVEGIVECQVPPDYRHIF